MSDAENTGKNTENLRPAWKPGQSGNPGGRPSQAALRAALRPHEPTAIKAIIDCLGSQNEKIRLMAAREFFDRLYGPPQTTKDAPSWLADDSIVEMLS